MSILSDLYDQWNKAGNAHNEHRTQETLAELRRAYHAYEEVYSVCVVNGTVKLPSREAAESFLQALGDVITVTRSTIRARHSGVGVSLSFDALLLNKYTVEPFVLDKASLPAVLGEEQ